MKSIIYITFLILKNYGNSREISRRKRSWLSSSSIDSIRASISSSSALSWTSSWKRGKVVSFISKIRVRFGYQKCSKKRPTKLIYFLACFTFWPIFRKIITNCDCSISVLWNIFLHFASPFKTRSALFEKNKWKNRSFLSLLRQTAMQSLLTLFKDFFSSIWSINESISSFSGIWSFSSLFSNSCHGMIHDSGRFHCSELV